MHYCRDLLRLPRAPHRNPLRHVKWGDRSWREMMIGWFDLAIDADKKPADIYKKKRADSSDD